MIGMRAMEIPIHYAAFAEDTPRSHPNPLLAAETGSIQINAIADFDGRLGRISEWRDGHADYHVIPNDYSARPPDYQFSVQD